MKRGAPIIAEYLGGAINCDAYHMTDPRADGLGVSSCIRNALEDGGVSPEEVHLSSKYYKYCIMLSPHLFTSTKYESEICSNVCTVIRAMRFSFTVIALLPCYFSQYA